MKLLTPTEYADAWDYLQEQTTRGHIVEVSDLIAPHVTRIEAETVRRRASAWYGDTPEMIAARRRDAVVDVYLDGAA